jgi:Ribonuclease G/E
MTRKRIGEGLLTAFADTCQACHGRGVIVDRALLEDEAAVEPGADLPAGRR